MFGKSLLEGKTFFSSCFFSMDDVFVVSKKVPIPIFIVKSTENHTMWSVQEHLHIFSCSAKVILAIFTSSKFLVHSSTNLSTNLFLHLQFSLSKYSPTLHDLSHSHSQLLGFQINSSSQLLLTINSLHLHQHLSYSNVAYSYKHLHLIYIYIYKFRTILYVLFHLSLTLD